MTTLYATVECIQRLEPFQTVVPLSISHHSLIRQLSQIVTSEFNVAPFSIVLLSQIVTSEFNVAPSSIVLLSQIVTSEFNVAPSLIVLLSQIVTSEFNVAPFSIVLLSQIEALYPIQHHSLIVL